jgi:hypothetical protein
MAGHEHSSWPAQSPTLSRIFSAYQSNSVNLLKSIFKPIIGKFVNFDFEQKPQKSPSRETRDECTMSWCQLHVSI